MSDKLIRVIEEARKEVDEKLHRHKNGEYWMDDLKKGHILEQFDKILEEAKKHAKK